MVVGAVALMFPSYLSGPACDSCPFGSCPDGIQAKFELPKKQTEACELGASVALSEIMTPQSGSAPRMKNPQVWVHANSCYDNLTESSGKALKERKELQD